MAVSAKDLGIGQVLAAPIPLPLGDFVSAPLAGSVSRTITYTYDNLYRLTGASYNDGTSFAYTYDAGLTQVLSDGSNIYLYGTTRIAEKQTGGWRYYAGDALGSVRQLVDNTGAVTLAKGYRPFGDPLTTMGNGASIYGFTGEQHDPTGLTYLRARYYSSTQGRFITRDTWEGNGNSSMSFNRWNYSHGDPINYTDPTGFIEEKEAKDAWDIMMGLKKYQVNIVVDWGYTENGGLRSLLPVSPELMKLYGWGCLNWDKGEWSYNELNELKTGVEDLNRAMKGKFVSKMGNMLLISQEESVYPGQTFPPNVVKFWSDPRSFDHWTVVHELGHVWDSHNRWLLSTGMMLYTGGHMYVWRDPNTCVSWERGCNKAGYAYGGKPPKGSDENFDTREDFAEAVTAYIYPDEAYAFVKDHFRNTPLYYTDFRELPRWDYIDFLMRH